MSNKFQEMIAGYIDGELSESERLEFEQELRNSDELKAELEQFRKLQEVTSIMRYADLPKEVWETYWESIYRKTERGLGWILFSIGAIVIACWGLFEFFNSMLTDPSIPIYIKAAIVLLTVGLVILIVSLGRERLFAYKRDRYKEINR